MDFFSRQPHPETNEIACTHYDKNAQPLAPVLPDDAVTCACAYFSGRYHLLVVPQKAPDTVQMYTGESIKALEKAGSPMQFAGKVLSVSWLLKPEAPFMCVYADKVYFQNLHGTQKAAVQLEAKTITAYHDDGRNYLVTDSFVYSLTESLSVMDQAPYPVKAAPCIVDNRTDVLYKTRRNNPGTMGGMLFRYGEKVHYVCCDIFERCTLKNMDTFICEVHSLDKPYSRRYLAIPNGGPACLFTGENGRVFAAFVGMTKYSSVYGKVAILPMDFIDGQFFRPDGRFYCETVPSTRLIPVGGIDQIRDSFIYPAPDGCYYLTGTTLGETGSYLSKTSALRLWRSKDLETFESLGKVFDYRETPSSWQNNISRNLNSWAPEMIFHGGTFWITYSTSPGCGLLKSASGRPEGPYLDMGRVVHKGIDSGLFEENGKLYLIWQNGLIAPLSEDGSEMTEEPVLLMPTDGQEVGYEGAGLIKVNGKYVLYAAEWNGDFRIDGTYDMMYSVSDSLMGPYCPRRLLVPHGGHSCLFYDHEGVLRYTIFGNDRSAPFRHSVGIGRVKAEEVYGVLTLEVQCD